MNGRQEGFTYIALLIGVAIVGATLAAVGQVWQTVLRHDRERDLIFIGDQFRLAINSYYASNRRYPSSLDDLVLDNRNAGVKRHLRKIFIDPMTGHAEWGLVTLPDGEIVGVHSLSEDVPFMKKGFRLADADLEDKDKYSDWVFMTAVRGGAYTPARLVPAQAKTLTSPSLLSRPPKMFSK